MNFSTNLITCTICHDPHAEAGTKLVRSATAGDLICQQCHQQWNIANPDALLTHPIVGNYLAGFAASDVRFKPATADANGRLSTNVGSGDVRLVNGGISCTSCHSTHYADSSSATADGKTAYNDLSLAEGDGKLLRSDGPLRTVTPYNAANSVLQAQLRSNLCQACHAYQTHGKASYEPTNDLDAVDETVGCLVCHSAHSYNAGIPNYFVLRGTVTTASFGPDKTTLYTTNPTSWETYCTSCHGSVSGFPTTLRAHTTGENCKGCHAHDGAYSFAMGDNATICGDCHGAPPRTNTPAVPGDVLIDTGYAVGPDVNYLSSGQNGKDESRTPHKIHAGALNADKAAVDYAFGSTASGLVSACLPCHNDQPDTVTPTHSTGTSAGSFQSVYFSPFATYNGVLTGQTYPLSGGSAWKCSNVYCHSNGGKRNATGTKVAVDFSVTPANLTPAWALGSNPGTIVATATECQQCHGENIATMAGAAKNNSQTHNKHMTKLNGGLNNKTTCYLCHSDTVDATGVVPATARDIRNAGKHVNGAVEVVFSSTALGGDLATGVYTGGASGTCAVYCHSNGKGSTVQTPDWDDATTGACGDCHATAAASLSVPHAKHLALTGLSGSVTCDDCHGAGAAAGTHTGHVDGLFTFGSCNACHGYDVGEDDPAWGETPVNDSYCIACHTGATRGSVKGTNAPNKTSALTYGHNATAGYASGNPAANKRCTGCHDTTATGHMDGVTGDDQRLIAAFACDDCHTAAGSRTAEATKDVVTHSSPSHGAITKACLACHEPHGSNTTNIFMVHNLQTEQQAHDPSTNGQYDFRGNVVFTSNVENFTATANNYDELDGTANTDDICATCHTLTTHNKYNVAGNHTTGGDRAGQKCTTCHPHNSGFQGQDCTGCHNTNGRTHLGTYESVTTHNFHNAATGYVTGCDNCHPHNGSGALHQNGTVNFGGTKLTIPDYAGADLPSTNCSTANSCHDEDLNEWSAGSLGADKCADCHASTAKLLSLGGYPPTSAKHAKHNGNTAYVPNKCDHCHGANAQTGAHTGHKLNNGIQTVVSYVGATQTCTVTCHAADTTGDWTAGGALACADCHAGSGGTAYIGGDKTSVPGPNYMPQYNMHPVTPTVSGKKHDATLTTCATCHTTITAQATHANGVWTVDDADNSNDQNRGLFASYTDAASGGTCSGAGVATGCHSDGGSWNRKWKATVANSDGTECANCHGNWTSGWTWNEAADTDHTDPYAGNNPGTAANNFGNYLGWGTGSHANCQTCHGWGAAGYNTAWRGASDALYKGHGDQYITMNGPVGTGSGYDNTTGGCASACHSSAFVMNSSSNWTANYGDYGSGSCAGCHAYPPTPGDGKEYKAIEGKGAHVKHVNHIAALAGVTLNPTTDVFGNANTTAVCGVCHDMTPLNHDNGTRAFAIPTGYQFGVSGPAYTGAQGVGSATTPKTCSAVSCHFKTTPVWE